MEGKILIYFLSVTGITLILCKSKLFTPLRSWISVRYMSVTNKRLIEKKPSATESFWWWLNSIFECEICMSIYIGIICAVVIYLSLYLHWIIYFLYPFAASPIVGIIIRLWQKLAK